MSQESEHQGHSRLRRASLVLLLFLPLLACLARLLSHPAYFIDGEALMTPTIGRELLHGHLLDAIHYQLIVYQGALLVDGLLTALGFAVFGDHLFAWQWLSLAYVLGISACGAWLLRRTGGPVAALAFLLLLAGAPFLVKDGMLAAIGGHSTGLLYALLAVALALPDREGRHRAWQPLAAGLMLGFGTWYLRTVVLAGPAVLLALWPAGRQALVRFGLGALLFPVLLLVNVLSLYLASSPDAVNGFLALLSKALWQVREFGSADRDLLAKLAEALCLPYQSLLFAQPPSAVNSIVPVRPGWAASSRIWVMAWSAAPVLVLAAIRWRPSSEAPVRALRSSAVVVTLVLTYALVYVLSPLRAEAILTPWAQVFPPAAPGVNAPRYLVPIYLLWTLLFAQGLGLLWARGKLRVLAIAALLLVAGSGLWQAVGDFRSDRDPLVMVGAVEPYYYFKMFGPGRGPPQELHEDCETTDPVSRSNHLFTLGSFLSSPPDLLSREPASDKRRLDELLERRKLTRDDAQILVHGMGRALGDQMFSSQELSSEELLGQAWRSAEQLGRGLAEPYLFGVGEAMDHGRLHGQQDALIGMLCRPMSWGSRPLCSLAGQMLVDTGIQSAPSSAMGLFGGRVPSFETQPEEVRVELIRGAAVEIANSVRTLQLRPGDLSSWPPEEAAFFQSAWQHWRDGERWHDEGAAGFLLGRYH